MERWIEEGTLEAKWKEFCVQKYVLLYSVCVMLLIDQAIYYREEFGKRDWTWVSGFSLRQPVPEFLQPIIHQVGVAFSNVFIVLHVHVQEHI